MSASPLRKFFVCLAMVALLFITVIPAHGVIRDGGIDPSNLGKGDWIYYMSDTTNKLGGNVASVTNENSLMLYYKSQGIRYMIVKAATSDVLFNGTYAGPQFTSNLVNIAHANGILIFGYNRSYGSNVVGEIAISDYVFNQGADGFIWDAESEWESGSAWIGTTGPAKAWQLCSTVRSNWPTKFLAHSPFAIVSGHSSFPYKEFGYWCDAAMPQIYHFSSSSVKNSQSALINWSDVNWNNWQNSLYSLPTTNINGMAVNWTNAIKPLAPIGDVYGPHTGQSLAGGTANPLPDKDVTEFIDYLESDPNTVTAGGYRGASFFRTDLHGTVQWANIKAGTLGNFSNVVSNFVMDDPTAAKVGAWTDVRTFYNGAFYGSTTDSNSFGTNYLFKSKGTGAAYVQFTPNVIMPGIYAVYEWHPQRSEASASVPFVINYSGGSTTVNANQQLNPGTWNLLGQFYFAAGVTGNIRVTDGIPESAGIAMADGVKLAFVPPANPAVISAVAVTNLMSTSATVTWTSDVAGDSTVNYGATTNYTALATNASLTSSHSITLSNLTAATTYHYLVASKAPGATQTVSGDFTFSTPPPGVVGNLIIDNTEATVVGTWSTGSSSVDKYGADYRFKTNGTGAAYLQYTPNFGATAQYRVYEWHPQGSNRSTNAPYVINFKGGSQTIGVNQQVGGGQWNLLGTFNFAVGTNGNVQITDAFPDSAHLVLADAIQFTYDSPSPFSLTNVSASSRQNGAIITWTTSYGATAQVQYGLTANYGSFTALDGAALTNHMVWLAGLTPNTTYYYRVTSTLGTNQLVSANYSFFTDPSVIVISSQALYAGVWILDSSAPTKYSPAYKFATTTNGAGNAQATFRPTITVAGKYDVSIWYSAATNRSANVPVTVAYSGGNFTTGVNMIINGGGWQLLASAQYFSMGTNGFVRLDNGTGETNKLVIADAVRWTYTAGQDASFIGSVPDWWSSFYAGSDTDANADQDADGYTTFMEYVLGTDPTDAHSQLMFAAQSTPGGVAVVFSPCQAGRLYQVQAADALAQNTTWMTLSNLPITVNTNGQGVIALTNYSGAGKFLRLSVQLIP